VQAPIRLEDVQEASEVFMTGGAEPIHAVTLWDGRLIGDGAVGIKSLVLRSMLVQDMFPPKLDSEIRDSPHWDRVPYGILTNMDHDMTTEV
jgi:hypothetical protein